MNKPEGELNPSDESLRSRLEYDYAISQNSNHEPVELPTLDPESAKTIRLLHDVLGPPSASESPTPHLVDPSGWELPKPFGRFEIAEKLGQGSFGAVWKAYDPILKRNVAIKALHPELRLIAKLHERFEKEAQATARLNHPNVVRLYEVGTAHGIHYLASEHVEGSTLRVLHNGHSIPTQEYSARLIAQLADAIHHAHLMGVLHRDIKPENVIIEIPANAQETADEGVPRLTDFGLARLIDQQTNEKHVSTTGLIVGSIDYMAPEQLMGESDCIGPSSDIYALGVMLFELLTGQLPRSPSGNVFRAIEMSLSPQDPRSLNPEIRRDLAAICMKCLAFSVVDRFRNASELRDDLQCFLNGKPTLTRPPTLVERFVRWGRSNRSLVAGMAIVLCSIFVALGVSVFSALLLSKRNGELILAKNAITTSERDTKVQEALYRNLAWMSALKLAYGKLERGDLQGVALDLGSIQQQHTDAAARPEWQVLNAELKSQYQLLFKESFALKDAIAIPNTNFVAVAGNDQTIRIVDRATQETVNQYKTSLREIHALAVSSNGKRIAAGGAVRFGGQRTYPTLLDLPTGTMKELKVSGKSTIESLAFSPNGSMLAIGCRYEDIIVTDLENSEKQPINLPATRRARTLHWVSDEEVVVHKTSNELVVHNLGTSESKSIQFAKSIESFATTKNGRWLIATNFEYDGCTLVSLRDTNQQIRLNGLQRQALCVAVSQDDKWVAAGVESGDVSIWQLPDPSLSDQELDSGFPTAPEIRKTLLGGGLNAISWSGNTVIAVGEYGEAIAWSPFSHVEPYTGESAITAVSFLQPQQAVLGFENGQVLRVGTDVLGNSLSGNLTQLPSQVMESDANREGTSGVYNLSWHNSKTLLATYFNGQIRELQHDNLESACKLITKPESIPEKVHFVGWPSCISQDGEVLAERNNNNHIHFISLISQKELAPIKLPGEIWGMQFLSPRILCVTGIFEGARIYDIETGKRVVTLGKAPSRAIFVNSNSRTVSIGFRDGYVRTWSMDSWELKDSLRTNDSLIVSICQTQDESLGICTDDRSNVIAFSPKGKMVLGKIRELNAIRNANDLTSQTCMLNADDSKLVILMLYMLENHLTSYVHLYELDSR